MVGNGKKLKILTSRSNVINTKQKSLTLNEVLHVPNIVKNLISVSKLTSNND